MNADPVVEEVRARGRALTARHGNDPVVLLKLLVERARSRPDGVVDTIKVASARPTEPSPHSRGSD